MGWKPQHAPRVSGIGDRPSQAPEQQITEAKNRRGKKTLRQKKAGCHTAGNEGATQNGEGLDLESLAAQTFPLRGPRRQRHLNN